MNAIGSLQLTLIDIS